MNRLGVDLQDLDTLLEAIKSASHISLEGMFSHFASSEVVDSPQVDVQLERFEQALQKAAALDLHPSLQHMANSAAIAIRPKSWFNLVRPGISLYGYYLPFTSVITGRADTSLELPVKPVLSWKTRVIQVREHGLRDVDPEAPATLDR